MNVSFIVLLKFLVCYFLGFCFADLSGNLIFTHIIFRHGDRTPIEFYPTDPWRFDKYWPNGYGQLTNIGKMQHYELGKWLRNRYNNLLNETYSKDEIHIQSTDVDRTLMSALSNLAGLYEPKSRDIWNENLMWQPIPVHTKPEKEDPILAGKKICPAYNKEYNLVRGSQAFRQIDEKYSSLYEYLTEHSGKSITMFEDVQKLNNTLFIESLYNHTLPEWTKTVFPGGDLKFLSDFSFSVQTYTRKLARLKIGLLIKKILDRSKKKAKHNSKLKQSVWIYSGHDLTISNVLNALKLFELHSPPYAATILFELRMDEKKPLISIFYKNTTETPKPLYIPDCGIQCPLEKMYSLYSDILPDDWEKECNEFTWLWLTNDNEFNGGFKGLWFGLGIFTFISAILAVLYNIFMHFRRRNYENLRGYLAF